MDATNESDKDVTGLILCGGLARRLGGVDKGLHAVAGRPLIDHVMERLRPQVHAVVISANRNRTAYSAWGYPVVADDADTFDGPLAGVLAALRVCSTPWLVSVPCDAPVMPVDLVEKLVCAADSAGKPTACPFDGERLQPTFCAFRRELQTPLEAYLAAGGRKIDRFLESVGLVRADYAGCADAFVNLNAPEDVSRYEAMIAGRE